MKFPRLLTEQKSCVRRQDRDNSGCLSGEMSGCSGESFARNDVVRKSDLTKQARARDQSGWTDRPPNANGNFENIAIPGAAIPSSEEKPPYGTVEQVIQSIFFVL